MSDTDLRALERATQQAPEDPAAWLARAQGAARVGARDEALEAFYRSAVLGGALPAIREGLRVLSAPATPWSHAEGDAARTRCSPLRGPRRGEIVARAPVDTDGVLVIAEEGELLFGQFSKVARLDARSLELVAEIPLEPTVPFVAPVAGPGFALVETGDRAAFSIEARTARPVHVADANQGTGVLRVEGGRVFVRVDDGGERSFMRVLSSSFELVRAIALTADLYANPSMLFAVDAQRIATFDSSGRSPALLVVSHEGAERSRRPLDGVPHDCPVLGPRGRIFVVARSATEGVGSLYHLDVLDEGGGRVARVAFQLDSGVGHVELAATPDGGAWLATDSELTRIGPAGRAEWTEDYWSRGPALVADRESWCYTQALDGDRSFLEGTAPDRSARFEVEGDLRPVAIDAWGRLLAVAPGVSGRGVELVAIA